MEVTVSRAVIGGKVRIPASKSHTIRALVIAALAKGESRIRRPLDSADTRSCLGMCRLLGAKIEERGSDWLVTGTGGEPAVPEDVLDAGNSGTGFYLLASAAALMTGAAVFTGDYQIRRRPIGNLLAALSDLGAEAYSTRGNGCAPVVIRGPLKGGSTAIRCPTSQFLSSLLLVLPLAQGDSKIEVLELNEKPYVEITLDWLKRQGVRLEHDSDLTRFAIPGRQGYSGFDREMPGDFSSATFFLCLAAIQGARVTIEGLDMADPQGDKAVVGMLEKMGARIRSDGSALEIEGGRLRGARLDLNATPDALPALAVTACFAEGRTELVNVPQARLKETDRIKVMHDELSKMGANVRELPDGLVIEGGGLRGARVRGHDDHRVVMALAVAGLCCPGETVIGAAESVSITFPTFFELIEGLKKQPSP
ncbi:MAG: 3-phosphoshikimate 1-carboxyvinyltransferase [Spirochaetales bacterium]|nr:3-phosphoshikimate 1-carboxyvinyltransferase [Spirochaetales bacterium]